MGCPGVVGTVSSSRGAIVTRRTGPAPASAGRADVTRRGTLGRGVGGASATNPSSPRRWSGVWGGAQASSGGGGVTGMNGVLLQGCVTGSMMGIWGPSSAQPTQTINRASTGTLYWRFILHTFSAQELHCWEERFAPLLLSSSLTSLNQCDTPSVPLRMGTAGRTPRAPWPTRTCSLGRLRGATGLTGTRAIERDAHITA